MATFHFFNCGRWAKTAYRKALVIEPYHAKAHASLGHLYLGEGNRKAAEQEYDALLGIDPAAAEDLRLEIEHSRTSAPGPK